MPTNTPNLNLIKPLVSEHYDVVVANANNDILDTAVGGLAPQATTYTKAEVDTQVGLLAPKEDPTFTGTQTLPNIVTNGIKFPATQVPSADPNTLDDYEKGTFLPTVIGGGSAGVGTYGVQNGKYTKIGNVVNIDIYISVSSHTGTGHILIGGLPFTPLDFSSAVIGSFDGLSLTPNNVLTAYTSNGSIVLIQTPVGGGVATVVTLDTVFDIMISISYKVS